MQFCVKEVDQGLMRRKTQGNITMAKQTTDERMMFLLDTVIQIMMMPGWRPALTDTVTELIVFFWFLIFLAFYIINHSS
jgi:hypothetical protein